MYLKKMYKEGSVKAGSPKVDHIRVLRANKAWNISPRIVERSIGEGWLSIVAGTMILKTAEALEDVVYNIERGPGHYCCVCEAALDDEHSARRHVLTEHAGADPRMLPADNLELQKTFGALMDAGRFKSTDKGNPAGYRRDNFYALTHSSD